MKRILNSKIVRKYHYLIEILLWIIIMIPLNLFQNGKIFDNSNWYSWVLVYAGCIFIVIALKLCLRCFYIGKVVKKFKRLTICERGIYNGAFSILWDQISCYKWDNDIGQHQYGMTFHLTDDFDGLIKLDDGFFELRHYVKREDKDQIREALNVKIKEIGN